MQNFKKTSVCLYLLSSLAFTSFAAQAAGKNEQDYFSDNNKYIYRDLTPKHFVLQGLPDDGAVVEAYQYDDLGHLLAIPFFKKVLKSSDNGGEISPTVDITFPALGLYKINVIDGNDKKLDERNVALIPPVGPLNDAVGVNTHFGQGRWDADKAMPLIKAAGIGWIRDEIPWSTVEKSKARFAYPSYVDNYIRLASELKLKPLVVLDYANERVYPGPIAGNAEHFANYAQSTVSRYSETVKHWEVWNEPRPQTFGTKDWEGYTAFLKQVYTAVKGVDKNSTVIACGGGGSGGGAGGDCVGGIFKYGGKSYMDAFSIHPYMSPFDPDKGYPAKNSPFTPMGGRVNVGSVSRLMESHIKLEKRSASRFPPVYVTEIGWPSTTLPYANGEAAQAAFLLRTLIQAQRLNIIRSTFWYDFVNDGANGTNKEHNFGLLYQDYTPKPAYSAMAVMNHMLTGMRFKNAVVDAPDVKVYRFSNGSKDLLVGWTVGTDKKEVPLDGGKKVQTDWQGNQTDIDGKTWTLGPIPRYLSE